MHIWLAPSRYSPHLGGIETVVAELAASLTDAGHHVDVITHRYPPDLAPDVVIDGVRVHRLSFESPSRSLRATSRFLQSQRPLRRELDQLARPEMIHMHGLSNQALPLASYASRRGIPLVVTTHGEISGDVERIYQRSKYVRASFRHACAVSKAVTAPSSQTLADAVHLAPRSIRKAVVVPNGVNRAAWSQAGPTPASRRVMAWGRLEEQKGYDRLLTAWPLVRAEVPDAALDIAGEGSQRKRLESVLSPGVRLLGRMTQSAVAEALQDVQFAAVPSRVEAFGMSALEALTAGRRVLHAGVPALVELVKRNGWSADHDDPVALAAAIVRALRVDPVTVPRSATAQCEWPRVTQLYLDLYGRECRSGGDR